MIDPSARLPPLNALRVFHVAMRHKSFRAAADELSVTPQAVSLQVKLLEDSFGPISANRSMSMKTSLTTSSWNSTCAVRSSSPRSS